MTIFRVSPFSWVQESLNCDFFFLKLFRYFFSSMTFSGSELPCGQTSDILYFYQSDRKKNWGSLRAKTESSVCRTHIYNVELVSPLLSLSLANLSFSMEFRGQFHQHIYAQLYARISQSVRTQSSHQYLFTLLGSTHVKAVHRILIKLSPGVNFINILWTAYTWAEPIRLKKTVKSWVFLRFWDLRVQKLCLNMLVKLTPLRSTEMFFEN